MNYTIAICDDDPIHIRVIQNYIEHLYKNNNFNFILSNSGEEVLSQMKDNPIHICFLDIEMNGINGLETGKKIKELYKDVVVVFITGFKEYSLNAFDIKAFDYIIKPISEKRFEILFKEILTRLEQIYYHAEKEKIFTIVTKDSIYKIKYNDIYYFEKNLRKIRIVYKGNELEFYGNFKNLKEELDMNYFTQCHQGYIVNISKISFYKAQHIFIEESNQYIRVGKPYINHIKNILFRSLLG